jgi:crotonobetainyl-CoA:carnitine CoA-transferase CaiB-like acyl-CoA transferase
MTKRELGTGESTGIPSYEAVSTKPTAVTRRGLIRGIGIGALGVGLGSLDAEQGAAQVVGRQLTWAEPGKAPYGSIRILELSKTLSGRLAGQMFADQGAEVFLERDPAKASTDLDDTYFDRGKVLLPVGALSNTSSADVIIVDGEAPVDRLPHQIVLRITAALPGDEMYGHLPADTHEDLLNAMVGFYTDMALTGPLLGRPVIYQGLPLCSVYAGVNGAVAVGAALVDRVRTGLGRDVIASRLAGGLSAIAALNLKVEGLPPNFMPVDIAGVPPGLTAEELREIAARAAADDNWRRWLEARFLPLGGGPYRSKDGAWFLPMTGGSRRNTVENLRLVGIYEPILKAGAVDKDVYDPANIKFRNNNLADLVAMRFDLNSKIADMMEKLIASRTAGEWQQYMANASPVPLPVTRVLSLQEWMADDTARRSGLVTAVQGTDDFQFGRMGWVGSAQPYPDLAVAKRAGALPPRKMAVPVATGRAISRRPLAGFKVLDFGNVIAAPSCSRMLEELGAEVTLVLPPDPQHTPTIQVAWSAELAQGKKSIIIDTRTPEGREVWHRLVARTDLVAGNKMDDQLARLGIDPISLSAQNPKAILTQITMYRGERGGPRANEKGYDPSAQAATGITIRFGGPDAPTYTGIASSVDYLCGYLGAWASVTALYAREKRGDGRGDWAQTSLCAAATLTQLLFQKPEHEPPKSARGQKATGPTPGQRWYKVADGWIFARAAEDISAEVAGKTAAEALAALAGKGIESVQVRNVHEIADIHRKRPTRTFNWQRTEKDGWASEMFAPTWFVFDNAPFPRSAPVSRMGADAREILSQLGYSDREIDRLVSRGAIGRTEWTKTPRR